MNTEIRIHVGKTVGDGFLLSDVRGEILLKKPRQFVRDNGKEDCLTVSIRQSSLDENVVIISANASVIQELVGFFDWLDSHGYGYWYSDPACCLYSLS